MTEEQILKELSLAIDSGRTVASKQSFVENVFNLINRQRTEIKELEIKLQAMRNAANGYKAEVKRLKDELELSNADKVIAETHEKAAKEMFVDVTRHLSSVKSEVIKEFAERLKGEWWNNRYDSPDVDLDDFVDNHVKEMVEVENNG